MSKEQIELMEVRIVEEDLGLSEMIKDIKPIKEQRFTDLELEANKNENFSIVLYKKQNPITRLFNNIRLAIEKYKIIKKSRNFEYGEKKI